MNWTRRVRFLSVAGLTAVVAATTGSASAAPVAHPSTTRAVSQHSTENWQRLCRYQFDGVVRAYVKTTQAHDAADFNALLDRDATVIFANGGVLSGKKEVAGFITDFFADPGWTQTFTKLQQHVQGCRSGFVLFDSVYSVPAADRVSPLVIGVTFTYRKGRWLVLHNQDSTGPAS